MRAYAEKAISGPYKRHLFCTHRGRGWDRLPTCRSGRVVRSGGGIKPNTSGHELKCPSPTGVPVMRIACPLPAMVIVNFQPRAQSLWLVPDVPRDSNMKYTSEGRICPVRLPNRNCGKAGNGLLHVHA